MIEKKSKNVKITKQEHAFKGFASTCNVKDTESAVKSKVIDLLAQLKGKY